MCPPWISMSVGRPTPLRVLDIFIMFPILLFYYHQTYVCKCKFRYRFHPPSEHVSNVWVKRTKKPKRKIKLKSFAINKTSFKVKALKLQFLLIFHCAPKPKWKRKNPMDKVWHLEFLLYSLCILTLFFFFCILNVFFSSFTCLGIVLYIFILIWPQYFLLFHLPFVACQ